MNAEQQRLQQPGWKKWGPYLSERQWGTVREDYSENGDVWNYFTHDHSRSRVYRWGEDGIAGISDDLQRICFAMAFWNGKDAILKERLFGLAGNEGNHGEDVKELYYYLDNTPTHSYMKHLYKYPQSAYPYEDLVNTNRQRNREEREYELRDTGIFDDGKYFDIFTEYAKTDHQDIAIRITIYNRHKNPAPITVLPTLWMRNRWSFGLTNDKPVIRLEEEQAGIGRVSITHPEAGNHTLYFEKPVRALFTENETNTARLFNHPNVTPFVKDAFHHAVLNNDFAWLEEKKEGTKFSPVYEYLVSQENPVSIRLFLSIE